MADAAISGMDPADALDGTELLELVQDGVNVKGTSLLMATYIQSLSSTAELIRDVIGSTLVAGSNVTITVDDSPNTITIASTGGGGGGGSGDAIAFDVAQTGHGFSVKDVLYYNGTAYAKARTDDAATCDVIGIVSAVADANNFTITQAGKLTTTGLTVGQYFLSEATAGLLTLTPSEDDGDIWKPVGFAVSTTVLIVNIQNGIVNGPSDVPLVGDMTKAVYDLAGVEEQLVGLTATQTLTGKSMSGSANTFTNIPLATAVTGNLPVANLNGGTGASSTTAWFGDGTWKTPTPTGDIFGPSSATDNALARFDTTTGKLLQNSGVIIDDSNNITGVGTFASGNYALGGTLTITSSSATAVRIGPNGATNPCVTINNSTASQADGIELIGQAAGNGMVINATSSGSNAGIRFQPKGSGGISVNGTSFIYSVSLSTKVSFTTSQSLFSPTGRTSGTTSFFRFISAASTSLTASTEAHQVEWLLDGGAQQHATGALTLQRDFRIRAGTHTAVGASTYTDAATFAVDSAPIASTNVSITNSSTYYSAGGAVGSGVTNSYGLNITANTGATNNYIARYAGSAGEVVRYRTDGQIALLATNTAGGTTGAQTINKPSGTVNFAAAATSLVVTNSLCTTSSIVLCDIRTNDTTAVIKNVVPGSGSFTITLNAAATAETSVGFLIIN